MEPTVITEAQYRQAADNYWGWCTKCKDFTTDGCESDARRYTCDLCGEDTVYGAEEAVFMELFDFAEDTDAI